VFFKHKVAYSAFAVLLALYDADCRGSIIIFFGHNLANIGVDI
jgi:hypothetical protein